MINELNMKKIEEKWQKAWAKQVKTDWVEANQRKLKKQKNILIILLQNQNNIILIQCYLLGLIL